MRLSLVVCLLLASLASQAARGQVDAGTISGTVRDTAGAPMSGAAIQAKNTETGVIYSTISGNTGNFALEHLPPGQYAISVTLKGMKPYAHNYLMVDKSVTREDVFLEVDVAANYVFPYNPPPVRAATPRPPPRDFFDSDAGLAITKPRISVNGTAIEMPQEQAAVKGKIAWIYLPGRGRYLLSLAPRSGFELAGRVGGTSLDFELGSDELQLDAKDRIAEGSGTYNLYVRHQSDWQPSNPSERRKVQLGSTDRLD